MNAQSIVYSIVGITIGIILTASLLIPQIAEYTGSGGVAEDYAGLLGVVIVMVIIAIVMMAVRLMGSKN